jgi:hypothetical protein
VNNSKLNLSSGNDFLLKTLMDYIVPFNKNNNFLKSNKKKEGDLEGKLRDSRKEKLDEILLLEKMVLESLKNPKGIFGVPKNSMNFSSSLNKSTNKKNKIKINRKINKKEFNSEEMDIFDFINNEKKNLTEKDEIDYSVSMTNEKEEEEKGYSISIRYEENESEEKLKVTLEVDDYGINKINKPVDRKKYSFSLTKKKEIKEKENYSVKIAYDSNYEQERLTIDYKSTIGAYLNKREQSLTDFSDRVPGKNVHIFPESVMGGILGFTYLGDNYMALRADLTGNLKKMVDIHESIHTPDEYETRILTDWIMMKERPRYVR